MARIHVWKARGVGEHMWPSDPAVPWRDSRMLMTGFEYGWGKEMKHFNMQLYCIIILVFCFFDETAYGMHAGTIVLNYDMGVSQYNSIMWANVKLLFTVANYWLPHFAPMNKSRNMGYAAQPLSVTSPFPPLCSLTSHWAPESSDVPKA